MFFFFKQKTAYEMRISDWSSDVCSSDLHLLFGQILEPGDRDTVHRKGQPAIRTLEGQDEDGRHRPVQEQHEQQEEGAQHIEALAALAAMHGQSSLRISTSRIMPTTISSTTISRITALAAAAGYWRSDIARSEERGVGK